MTRLIKILLVTALSVCSAIQISFAQDTDIQTDSVAIGKRMRFQNSEGTEFWLCFQRNFKDPKTPTTQTELHLELFLTGDQDARVNITIDGIGYNKNFNVSGGTVLNVKIPAEAQVKSDEVKERLAVHVTSSSPISVYGLNRRFQTTDTYLGHPVNVLGTQYMAIGYSVSEGLMSHFAVVGVENNTEVTITPTVNTNTHPAGIPYKITLNKGDVYQVAARNDRRGDCDITGSQIVANKKIAVFSGHQCAYIPQTVMACNHLVEQIPPVPSWGKHFYLGMLKPRSNYTFRVLASENNTRIFLDAVLIKTLNQGQYWDSTINRNVQITASKPVLVAQYSQGFKNGDLIGDPMMLLASPTQQFMNSYRFATPINGSWKHNINVVVPNNGISGMRLDGKPINKSLFEQLGISRYSIATINIPYGSHIIEGDLPFGMYSYGFGFGNDAYDAYGTMAGQSFVDFEPVADDLPPMADLKKEDIDNYIIARDDRINDSGIKDITVKDNQGIEYFVPKIEPGTPQVPVLVGPSTKNVPGRMVFVVRDLSLNESTFTLCYYYNDRSGDFEFSLQDGETNDCMPDPGFIAGAFFKPMFSSNTADFTNTGNVKANGQFQGVTSLAGYFGLYFGRRIVNDVILSARLTFENYPGTLEARDSVLSKIRNTDGSLVDFQEARTLKLEGLSTTLTMAAEYKLNGLFYLVGGLNFTLQLSDAVRYSSRILIPDFYTYGNGERELVSTDVTYLSSLNSFRVGLAFGAGLNVPFTNRLSAFGELLYNVPLMSIINDASWYVHQYGLQIGVKYRI
jgi:hypothetical protein